MAQRKTPPAKATGRSAGAKVSTTKPSGRAGATATRGPSGRPPVRKPGKSIVHQKQRPWGLIATTAVVVVFAVVVLIVAISGHKSSNTANPDLVAHTKPEIAAAKAIPGLIYKKESHFKHVSGVATYDASPPMGGDHSAYWADCSGTVYPNAIANENAVHMLEHGAVWITYRPDLPKAQVDALAKLVNGVNYMAMSPYPGLKAPISLQAWNYQLFVNTASDPRIEQFISALRNNPASAPESPGECSQPTFKQHPSTFGHPLEGPASGQMNK